jgi:hypothetical protein
MINSYEPKTKSSDVDLFLKVLKNKPKWAPTSGKESPNVQVFIPHLFSKTKGGAHKYIFVG